MARQGTPGWKALQRGQMPAWCREPRPLGAQGQRARLHTRLLRGTWKDSNALGLSSPLGESGSVAGPAHLCLPLSCCHTVALMQCPPDLATQGPKLPGGPSPGSVMGDPGHPVSSGLAGKSVAKWLQLPAWWLWLQCLQPPPPTKLPSWVSAASIFPFPPEDLGGPPAEGSVSC